MSKLMPIKPFFLMLYGFPGSGKTYFARQFCESVQAAHLQADRIRGELFEKPRFDKQENAVTTQLLDYMTEEFLSAGLSVVYDTNAIRAGQRQKLREMAKKHHAQPLLLWLQSDIESCFARNVQRDRRRADDKYAAQWDRTTFDNIVSHMQKPRNNEGFIVISGKHLFSTQRNVVVTSLKDKGILSINDNDSEMAKPGMVNLVPGGRVDMSRRNILIR